MLSSFLITLREGLEAALLVGIVMTLLVRSGGGDRTRAVWAGVAAAVAASFAAGALLFATGAGLEGTTEQVFEAVAMILAAIVLSWMILWMRRQSRKLMTDMDGRVGGALAGGAAALFWLGFVVVVREGLETALFLFAAAGEAGGAAEVAGAVLGLAGAVAIGVGVYRGALRLDLRRVFTVLNVALLAFAGYLVWGAIGEVGELLGGEAAEIAGPLVAAAYLATMILLYRRAGRGDAVGATDDVRGADERARSLALGGEAPRGVAGHATGR